MAAPGHWLAGPTSSTRFARGGTPPIFSSIVKKIPELDRLEYARGRGTRRCGRPLLPALSKQVDRPRLYGPGGKLPHYRRPSDSKPRQRRRQLVQLRPGGRLDPLADRFGCRLRPRRPKRHAASSRGRLLHGAGCERALRRRTLGGTSASGTASPTAPPTIAGLFLATKWISPSSGWGRAVTLDERAVASSPPALPSGRLPHGPFSRRRPAGSFSGKPADEASIAEAARAARAIATPIDDMRGTVEFRLHVTEVLVRRVLSEAVARARRATREIEGEFQSDGAKTHGLGDDQRPVSKSFFASRGKRSWKCSATCWDSPARRRAAPTGIAAPAPCFWTGGPSIVASCWRSKSKAPTIETIEGLRLGRRTASAPAGVPRTRGPAVRRLHARLSSCRPRRCWMPTLNPAKRRSASAWPATSAAAQATTKSSAP